MFVIIFVFILKLVTVREPFQNIYLISKLIIYLL